MINRQIIQSNTIQKDISSIITDIEKCAEGKPGGIRLNPDYQRTYQFGEDAASLLIESLIIGIPIPTIYLATDSRSSTLMYNVIDGQHRLRSIYNYITGKYSLKSLKKNEDLNGKYFDDLDENLQNVILYQNFLNFVNIHVQDNQDIEIEIFERYNRNTQPLTDQEIRNAVYMSDFSKLIQKKIDEWKNNNKFITNLNMTTKRMMNSTLMENIIVGVCIMLYGPDKTKTTSPMYAQYIMEKFSVEYSMEEEILVNKFLSLMEKVIIDYDGEYLFSKELINDYKSNYKFQIPSFMIFSMVLHLNYENSVAEIISIYKSALEYHNELMSQTKTSSTNPIILENVYKELKERE